MATDGNTRLTADDLAALHVACVCGPSCDLCDAEDAEDASCYEGSCSHDACIADRTEHVERRVV
jgi:hypothetical protein